MWTNKKESTNHKNAPKPREAVIVEAKPKKKRKIKTESFETAKKFNFNIFSYLGAILDGSFLTKERVIKLLPFWLFITLIALVYISNNYIAQRKIKQIDTISTELKELRNEHISTKSELMFHTRMSEVAKKLSNTNIVESVNPPIKIIIKDSLK